MTNDNNQAAAIVAAEPADDDINVASTPTLLDVFKGGTPAGDNAAEPEHTVVEVRHRGRLSSLLSMLSCRKSAVSDSVHFHAQHVEDSVHVMIKHDKEACKRRGQPMSAYKPRAPISEQLAAARKLEAARQEQQGSTHKTISAKEEDESDTGRDILAALSKADCGAGDSSAAAAAAR